MKAIHMAALFVVLALLGCGGQYDTSAASEAEREAVRTALTAYLAELQEHADAGEKVMPEMLGVESFEIVSLVRMKKVGKLKALVSLKRAGSRPVKRYVILRREDETLVVEGVL